MTEDLVKLMTGPVGGAVAVGLFTGCGLGYGFAMKTMVATGKERMAEMKAEIDELRDKVDKLQADLLQEVRKG